MPQKLWLYLCHAVCLVAVAGSGIPCIFPVVSDYLQHHFNLTQSEVGVIAITSQVGESLHLPSALIFDFYGPKWTMGMGLLISTTGWVLTWWASIQPIEDLPNFEELALYFFLIGLSRTFMYSAGFLTILHNISSKRRGKTIAFGDALFESTVLCVFLVYRGGLLGWRVRSTPEENTTFFLLLLIAATALFVLPTPFMSVLKDLEEVPENPDRNENEENETTHLSQTNKGNINPKRLSDINCESFCDLLLCMEYHLLLWGTSITIAICHFTLFNITSVSNALNISYVQRYLLGLYKAGILLSRLFGGFLCDRFSNTKCIYKLLVGVSLLGVISQTLFIVPYHPEYLVSSAYLFGGIVEGWLFISVPIFVIDVFGLDNLGRNVSLIYTVKMVLTVLLQIVYDAIYDSFSGETILCIGLKCILPTFSITISLTAIAAVSCMFFSWRILSR